MKIGVLSDTHIPSTTRFLPPQVFEIFKGVDLILHAGDIVEISVLDELRAIAPVEAVAGNMDVLEVQRRLATKKVLQLGRSRVGLIHGKFRIDETARLSGMPIKFNSLTSSTMTRARQTALVINEDFPELKLQQSTLIRECTPPTWRKDIMADENESDLNMCAKNLESAFTEYFLPSPDGNDRNDIIVCHGNVIRYFVTKILKADPMSWLQMSIVTAV